MKKLKRAMTWAQEMCEARERVIETANDWASRRYALGNHPSYFYSTWERLYMAVSRLKKLEAKGGKG